MRISTRREFLCKSVSVGAGLASAVLVPRRIFAQDTSGFNRIAYRQLGSTGEKVSEIGFGAMNMRDPELLQAGIDYGINYIDTAWDYMNGVNERVVGQVTKPVRDKVFITTKVIPGQPGEQVQEEMMKNMETSLQRLKTDHVDLMLLHAVDSRDMVLYEEFMQVIDKAREKGICRFVGVSAHENHAEVLDAAVESNFWEVVLVGYNYMSPPGVRTAIEKARNAGLGIVAMKNLLNPIDLATWNWEVIPDIREDKNANITPQQALIKWVLDDSNVDTTIPGVTSFEQLADNVAIMGMPIKLGERRTLYRLGENLKGCYCRGAAGCTGCFGKCPKGIKMNDLNRCLSYAYGYGDIELAKENYANIPESSRVDVCADCKECVVRCVNGIDLNETVRRARELFT